MEGTLSAPIGFMPDGTRADWIRMKRNNIHSDCYCCEAASCSQIKESDDENEYDVEDDDSSRNFRRQSSVRLMQWASWKSLGKQKETKKKKDEMCRKKQNQRLNKSLLAWTKKRSGLNQDLYPMSTLLHSLWRGSSDDWENHHYSPLALNGN